MGGFIYFTDEVKGPINPARIAEADVQYAFEGPGNVTMGEIKGRTPSGKNGWLFANKKVCPAEEFGYFPEQQKWRKVPKGKYWVAMRPKDKPTPATLRRQRILQGSPVRLADGNEWIVPRLRLFSEADGFQVALPLVADLDENGEWVSSGADPRHARLNEVADRLHEASILSFEDKEKGIETGEMLDIAAELIGANYLVSRFEVAFLGLLTTDASLVEIGRIAMDMNQAEQWLKKKMEEIDSQVEGG